MSAVPVRLRSGTSVGKIVVFTVVISVVMGVVMGALLVTELFAVMLEFSGVVTAAIVECGSDNKDRKKVLLFIIKFSEIQTQRIEL